MATTARVAGRRHGVRPGRWPGHDLHAPPREPWGAGNRAMQDFLTGNGHPALAHRDAQTPLLHLQTVAGNGAVTRLVTPTATDTPIVHREPGREPESPPGILDTLSKIGYSLFKATRTTRILLFQSARDAQVEASKAHGGLRMLRREAEALANRVSKSGGGPKVQQRLGRLLARIAAEERALATGQASLRDAHALVQAEQGAAQGLLGRIAQLSSGGGVARPSATGVVWRTLWPRIGSMVNQAVRVVDGWRGAPRLYSMARKLGSPMVGRSIIGLAAVLEGIQSYTQSHARTEAGRVSNAVLGAGTGALVVANPVTAIADVVLPERFKLSTMYRGGSGAVTTIAEGLATGDTRGMEDFHQASKEGRYGAVMQASSEAGDFWADHGILGGLREFRRELRSLW